MRALAVPASACRLAAACAPRRRHAASSRTGGLSWEPSAPLQHSSSPLPSASYVPRPVPAASRHAADRGQRVRVAPEEISYSVVIEACARNGDTRGAEEWVERMKESPFKPNVFVYNAVIAALARKGNADEAIRWFRRMVAAGLVPNVMSYVSVIDGCAKANDPEGAAKWFGDLATAGLRPNNNAYNAVINSSARVGDADAASSWLDRMWNEKPPVSPDVISYSTAINGCAQADPPQAELAERLFRQMRDVGLHPTASTLSALERALGAARSDSLCAALQIDVERQKRHRPPMHRSERVRRIERPSRRWDV